MAKYGFTVMRQKGSHVVLRRVEPFSQLVIPDHKELDTGTLRAIIRQGDISIEDFIKNI
ncbi:MAG TPA: type II toxin-antitoxin system HicA family toxin [Spirochaetales bacterium]|nr:type II toxin-antitoxin system HicA family toxin [Spirochaetales bacterium]